MKIKRYNENSEINPGDVIVKVSFSGDINIPLKGIKETDYFQRYYENNNYNNDTLFDSDDYKSAIFYGAEEYIHNSGVCNYTISYQTDDGKPILDLVEYEKLMINSSKYNI